MTARLIARLVGGASLTLAVPAIAQIAAPALPPATSGTYGTISSAASVGSSKTGGEVAAKTSPVNSLSVTYDAASRTYRLSSDATYSFGPAQSIGSAANTADYRIRLPSLADENSNDSSKMVSIFENPAVTYTYTRYGFTFTFQRYYDRSSFATAEAFVFGSTTPAGSLPRTGAAYYTGLVDGWASGRLIDSTGSLLANFSTNEIATGLNLSTATGFVGRFDGRGFITQGTTTFTGSLFGSGNVDYVGSFNGGFFGPAAQEVGLTFSLANVASMITGVFIGTGTVPPASPDGPPITPQTPINTTLVAPIQSETFSAIGGEMFTKLSSSTSRGQSAVARTEAPGEIKIAYNAATNTYAISDTYGSDTFAPDGYPSPNINSATKTRTATRGVDGRSLILSVPGPTNPRLALTYLSYGLWQTTRNSFATRAVDRSFIYGVETPSENLPRSGAALYDGEVAGTWASGNYTYDLAGRSDGSILANFYTGEVRTRMALAGRDSTTGAAATLGRVDGLGSIASGTAHFTGTMTSTDNVYSGNFQGAFYGPAYQEAGASFALAGANGAGSVNGIIVAKQTPIQ